MRNMKTNRSIFLELFWNDELLPTGLDWGLLMLRSVSSFYLMALHGLKKIGGGPEDWQSLGKAGMNHFGIEFGHVYFGFLAAFSEGVLTVMIIAGLLTRPSALMVALTMFFAGSYHLNKGEDPESAFIYMIIFLFIFLVGPGRYSIDSMIKNWKS